MSAGSRTGSDVSSWPGIAVRRTASLPLACDPAIHDFVSTTTNQDVDARVKRAHDGGLYRRLFLQLRLVARLDFGLRLRLPEPGLLVNHLANRREGGALDLRLFLPQPRAHQCLAAMEIGFLHRDA